MSAVVVSETMHQSRRRRGQVSQRVAIYSTTHGTTGEPVVAFEFQTADEHCRTTALIAPATVPAIINALRSLEETT